MCRIFGRRKKVIFYFNIKQDSTQRLDRSTGRIPRALMVWLFTEEKRAKCNICLLKPRFQYSISNDASSFCLCLYNRLKELVSSRNMPWR